MEECVMDAELFAKFCSEGFSEYENYSLMDGRELQCLIYFLGDVIKKGECIVYYTLEIMKKYSEHLDKFPPVLRELFNGLLGCSKLQEVKVQLDRIKQDEIERILPDDKKEKLIYIIAAGSLTTNKLIISTYNDIKNNYIPYHDKLLSIPIPVGFNNICTAFDETR